MTHHVTSACAGLLALTLASPALAQDETDTDTMPEGVERSQDETREDEPRENASSSDEGKKTSEKEKEDEQELAPLTPPAEVPPSREREAFERRLSGWTALGIGVPAALWGASQLGAAANEQDDPRARNRTAQSAGAAMLGGAAVAAQGASILHEEDRKERQAEAAARRAKLFPTPDAAPDLFLITLERDAERAREMRDTAGTAVMLGGILAGALIGAAPTQTGGDRVPTIVGGAALAGAAIAGGLFLWNTPSPEEILLDEARQAPRPDSDPR